MSTNKYRIRVARFVAEVASAIFVGRVGIGERRALIEDAVEQECHSD